MLSSADADPGSSNPLNVVGGLLVQLPEPAVLLLLGAGLLALAIWGYRKRKKKPPDDPS